MNLNTEQIVAGVQDIVEDSKDRSDALQRISELLKEEVPHYDWVGFYLVEDGRLKLGPFVGDDTEHTDIDFGEGICGQAAEREENFVVPDVSEEDNYLSCSPRVRSEIVVPIYSGKEVVGELDIDSHTRDTFTERDEKMLGEICEILGEVI